MCPCIISINFILFKNSFTFVSTTIVIIISKARRPKESLAPPQKGRTRPHAPLGLENLSIVRQRFLLPFEDQRAHFGWHWGIAQQWCKKNCEVLWDVSEYSVFRLYGCLSNLFECLHGWVIAAGQRFAVCWLLLMWLDYSEARGLWLIWDKIWDFH